MPHIVLEGPADLKHFLMVYQPANHQSPGEVLKLQNIFMDRSGALVLIESLAVEQGPPNRFLVQVAQKEHKTTVKCYPATDPEKTRGVKKILALVARQLLDHNPSLRYGTTNLKDFLL